MSESSLRPLKQVRAIVRGCKRKTQLQAVFDRLIALLTFPQTLIDELRAEFNAAFRIHLQKPGSGAADGGCAADQRDGNLEMAFPFFYTYGVSAVWVYRGEVRSLVTITAAARPCEI